MQPREHWESVYRERAPEDVSWFQPDPAVSLDLIRQAAPRLDARILDVGGGASRLVDALLAAGYTSLTVNDVSPTALAHAQQRLGSAAARVTWLPADILTVPLAAGSVALWHDRAVFHFLTRSEDQEQYLAQVRNAVAPGGHVLVATFAEDGPARCSGLAVARYSPQQLHDAFGPGFELAASRREVHVTPRGAPQAFTWCLCRRLPASLGVAAA